MFIFGRGQRLKWLHKVLAIEVNKQLQLEAVGPSLREGTNLIFFGTILYNVNRSSLFIS